jgi:polysaccharide chain length determinant protein (PEP-CTERM system associated)
MLPGKRFTPDDILGILRRRLWLVLVPAAVIGAAAALYARSLPNEYFSYSLILVVPQRISESLVRNTITSSIEDRLPSIRAQVLSRTSLERIISEFDLYPEERKRMVMSDVVALMERNIVVEISGSRNDTFRVGFRGNNATLVTRVAQRLGNLFIDQSLSYRSALIEDTTSFLDTQLAEKRRELEEVEQKLAAYQRQHAGELPSQQLANIQQLQNANTRLQSIVDSINRSRERRLQLEQQLADVESTPVVDAVVPSGPVPSGSTLAQLTAARQEVAALEARGFRPGHPDLDAAQRRVRDLTARLAAESSGGPDEPVMSPAEAARQARMSDLRAQIAEVDRQIALAQQEEQRAREVVQATEARIDASPMREAELTALTRDYGIIESAYRDLLFKREAARLSANLEQRQVGESFRTVDPARIPDQPSAPDRPRISLFGLAIGLGFGLGLAGLFEFRDRTIRTDEDLALVLDLPVLAVVPVMESAGERRRNFWIRALIHSTCAVVVLAGMTVFAYVLATA